MVSPEAYSAVLRAMNAHGIVPIIVGGQAVNLWATIYEGWDAKNNPEPGLLQESRPFTSRDLDLSGVTSREIVTLPGVIPPPAQGESFRDFAADTGIYYCQSEKGEELSFQLLKRVIGADNAELETRSIQAVCGGAQIRLPDPLILLKCKLANMKELDQRCRNDLPHAKMMIRCVRAYIGEDIQSGVDARKVLNLLKRLLALQKDRYAKWAKANYGIDLNLCIPLPQLLERAKHDEKIRNFVRYTLGIGD